MLRFSTGLRQYLQGGGCMRKAFCDSILKIYSGVAPATADLAAPSGDLLVEITKASGSYSHDAVSTAKQSLVTITAYAQGNKNIIVIDGVTFSYTALGSSSVTIIATALVALIDADLTISVCASSQAGLIHIKSKFPGEEYTITVSAGDGGGAAPGLSENSPAKSRIDALHLGVPAAGVIAKETGYAWSGEITLTGTAGYFRLVQTTDDGDENDDDIRLQGNISTSGAELNLSNLNLVDGATLTIDTFQLTEPAA